MAEAIVCRYFDKQWYLDNIVQDAKHSRPTGFLRLEFTPEFEGKRKYSRLLDFAEMPFNLQYVEGFDGRVDQMRSGQIEATFAEFDFALPLRPRHRVQVRHAERCEGQELRF
jgi:hypothetical protein